MNQHNLERIGARIARLRTSKHLKQAELAFEAGISERTLQRIEAGEVVKSDGLIKVIGYLGRLDEVLSALSTPEFSPYELAGKSGGVVKEAPPSGDYGQARKTRVRDRTKKASTPPARIIWPEDQS